jgi:hypothetical protein
MTMTFEKALAIADKFDATQAKAALHDFMVLCRAGLDVKSAFMKSVRATSLDVSSARFSGRLVSHVPWCDCSLCKPPHKIAAEFNARAARERLAERD